MRISAPFDMPLVLSLSKDQDRLLQEVLPPAEARLLHDAEAAVRVYLRHLGFGAAATEAALPQCLAKARKRVGRGPSAVEELQRCAVEDVQRRLDQALGLLLGFAADDLLNLARARAALLLGGADFPKDHLLTGQPVPPEAVQALATHLPTATPPEAPLPMAAQAFRFILRR